MKKKIMKILAAVTGLTMLGAMLCGCAEAKRVSYKIVPVTFTSTD